MAAKKILAIIGATGNQGGGLVRAILNDKNGGWAVRAITRRPDSSSARALAEAGAEVVSADSDDRASLERAFAGAYGAFCVTNFWEIFSPEREIAQATNMAYAAKAARLEHVVWSTLEDVRRWVKMDDPRYPTQMGKYKVPHTDAKGEADQAFRTADVPTTFLLTSYFWENFNYPRHALVRGPDGNLNLALPLGSTPLPGIGSEDIGRSAYGIFQRRSEFVGKTIGVASDHLTGTEMAEKLSRALDEHVRYGAVPTDLYRKLSALAWEELRQKTGFAGGEDLANSFQFSAEFSEDYRRSRDVAYTRTLNPELETFDQWLARNKTAIQVPPRA